MFYVFGFGGAFSSSCGFLTFAGHDIVCEVESRYLADLRVCGFWAGLFLISGMFRFS